MKIALSEIGVGGLSRRIKDVGLLSNTGVKFVEPPIAEFTLQLLDETTATLDGNITAALNLSCSRCGQPVVFQLNADYCYIYKLGQDSSLLEKELECSEEDCDTVFLEEPTIDIESVLQEQLILSSPTKLLCSENCKGLCYQCGKLLNEGLCDCDESDPNSPFNILKQLKS